ncbi:MAG TPA: PAS domain-containing sensor histidine kinase, partial [Planctomycetes bacterium]|nr:PAS domain-containing sensor histidine kinase [Planctomycetota bacterium]
MKRRLADVAYSITPETLVDLADGLRLGIVIVDADGTVGEVNAAAAPVFRPGANLFEAITSPDDIRRRWDELKVGELDCARIAVERNERRRWLETVFLRQAAAFGMFVFRDITIKLDAQEELLRERSFYRTLLGQLGVGLMLIDRGMHILWVNEIAANLLSKAPEPGCETCFAILTGGGVPCAYCPAVRAFETGEVSSGEVCVLDKDGASRIMHLVAAPIRDYRGRVEQVSLVMEDVTEKRKFENEYRERLEREVERKTRDLNESNRRLRMLDKMKDEFLANVTHELRTPLVSGIGYIELLLQGGGGPLHPQAREGLDISHRNLLRLVGLIEDLLTFARISTGREDMQREPVDIARMIRECASDLTIRTAGRRKLSVTVEIDDNLPPVYADTDKLFRVITNLLSNAEKFAAREGRVHIRARRSGGEAEVAVEDNGPGIPVEERELVFERFHRGTVAVKAGTYGTGIGLS